MPAPTTVVKALLLLNLVGGRPGLTLTEISRETGLPAPTAHRLLRTLRDAGLLRVDSSHRYFLGSHCLVLGSQFLETIDVRTEAEPYLDHLVKATGETAHLGVPDGTEVIYVAKVDSPKAVRMYSRIGARSPMHSTAMGKAILSFGEDWLVRQVIDAGLPRRTPNTLTDPDQFQAELEKTRQRGYAIDDIENEEGIRCVAAPILAGQGNRPVGAISVSGPADRMTDERLSKITVEVMGAAEHVADSLGYRKGGAVTAGGVTTGGMSSHA